MGEGKVWSAFAIRTNYSRACIPNAIYKVPPMSPSVSTRRGGSRTGTMNSLYLVSSSCRRAASFGHSDPRLSASRISRLIRRPSSEAMSHARLCARHRAGQITVIDT